MATPDIREIGTFVRVVRHGSLAGAARELELPKSTVSRRIGRLEERLGAELIHRTPRKVVVTRAGKRLFDRVAGSVDAIEAAVQGTADDVDAPRGHIRMTAPTDVGHLFLIDELMTFAEACPAITVDLQLTDRIVDIARDGFDLGVRAGAVPDSAAAHRLIQRPLMNNALRLAASPDLAAQVTRRKDLERVPFVLFRTPTTESTLRLRAAATGRVHEVTVHGRFVVHDYTSMAELVARGAGVGLMPALHVDRARGGPLVPVLPDLSAGPGAIVLVYPTRRLPERVRVLVDHLTRGSERLAV